MNIQFYFLIFLLLFSCKTDNFYDTERILYIDKSTYNIGDKIKITMKITPQKSAKKIRIYENYKNICFSFSIINDEKNIYNGHWSNMSGKNLPISNIKDLHITKERPLIIEYIGIINMTQNNVYIHFPKLNYRAVFKKEILEDDDTFIRIHGISDPIKPELGAPLKEYFNTRDFKINL